MILYCYKRNFRSCKVNSGRVYVHSTPVFIIMKREDLVTRLQKEGSHTYTVLL